jgi:hypothetical protein
MEPRILLYRWFAKTYGWTPDQVEAAPLEVQQWFPLIEEAAQEAQDFLTRQEMNAAKGAAGPRRR